MRKIVQITASTAPHYGGFGQDRVLFALCDDATVWWIDPSDGQAWWQGPPIPQDTPTPEPRREP